MYVPVWCIDAVAASTIQSINFFLRDSHGKVIVLTIELLYNDIIQPLQLLCYLLTVFSKEAIGHCIVHQQFN